ncbi:MAG: 4-hydroxy-3-methylbut-2-enyl diphosphate reductase, partial [Thiotrichaceae bacterium]|nr:4-hydroxy-3-methylbut-2-enyl diphosphate reductase [Thiotrichaceae bacterium]
GLKGHAAKNALVISSENDLTKIDYTHPISIFSQTTQGLQAYFSIIEKIKENVQQANGKIEFVSVTDSICRQVSNREEELRKFAIKHDIILFVAGKDSSNGKQLFAVCKRANSRAFFMSNISELPIKKIVNAHSIGICGATSTTRWQMTDVLNYLIKKKN